MARPESHADVDQAKHQVEIATIKYENLGTHPELAVIIAEAMSAMERAGAVLAKEYHGTVVYAPATARELDDELKAAQAAWDTNAKTYAEIIDGKDVADYVLRGVASWAAREGKEHPTERRNQILRERLSELNETVSPGLRAIADNPQA